MLDHFAMFAAYNRWANARLYAAAATLTDEEYRSDRGAFFGSLHGALNHILVADRIWLHRPPALARRRPGSTPSSMTPSKS
jgi:uncharacterized damage-inducible protein DinB